MYALVYSLVIGVSLSMILQSALTLRSYRSRSRWQHVLATPALFPVWAVIFSAIVLALVPTPAHPSESCPSLTEGRKLYPNKHLYWHMEGGEKCWGSERVIRQASAKATATSKPAHVRYSVNRNPLRLGKPPTDANGNIARHSGKPVVIFAREDEYNEMDAQADKGPSIFYPAVIPSEPVLLLTPRVMTGWPILIDIDVQQVFTPWEFRVAGAFER